MCLYLANFNLMIFLFVQFSNQPQIINTYLNIAICLCSIHSKHLPCINVESCFCISFFILLYMPLKVILYVLKMCHLKHRLRIFLFCTKIMFCSQDIQVFVLLTIPWFTKSVTSRWDKVTRCIFETRWIFEYIIWTTNDEVTILGQLIDISKDNNFQ